MALPNPSKWVQTYIILIIKQNAKLKMREALNIVDPERHECYVRGLCVIESIIMNTLGGRRATCAQQATCSFAYCTHTIYRSRNTGPRGK
jgi:hypothetical protein